jgi:hypothetical protein
MLLFACVGGGPGRFSILYTCLDLSWDEVSCPGATAKPPIIEHFPILSSFLNQIERNQTKLTDFCWTSKLEAYKCSFSITSTEASQRTKEEDE